MLTAEEVHSELIHRPIPTPTVTEVESILDGIDQTGILDEEESNLSWEIWNKESPINGTDAETMLDRSDVDSSGAIYLIREGDGRVLVFQPCDPTQSGRVTMTESEAETVAASQVEKLATSRANSRVISLVMEEL